MKTTDKSGGNASNAKKPSTTKQTPKRGEDGKFEKDSKK